MSRGQRATQVICGTLEVLLGVGLAVFFTLTVAEHHSHDTARAFGEWLVTALGWVFCAALVALGVGTARVS